MAQANGGEGHDNVSRPAHYTREGAMECIDEMLLVFGTESVKSYRATKKNGDEDMRKSDWYMAKYRELEDNLGGRGKNAKSEHSVRKIFRRTKNRRRT